MPACSMLPFPGGLLGSPWSSPPLEAIPSSWATKACLHSARGPPRPAPPRAAWRGPGGQRCLKPNPLRSPFARPVCCGAQGAWWTHMPPLCGSRRWSKSMPSQRRQRWAGRGHGRGGMRGPVGGSGGERAGKCRAARLVQSALGQLQFPTTVSGTSNRAAASLPCRPTPTHPPAHPPAPLQAACLVLSVDETVRNPRSEAPDMSMGGMGGRGGMPGGRGRGRGRGRGMRR